MEKDFYITEYLGSSRDEMKCVFKHLYSDFIVKEIASDGTMCEVCTSSAVEKEEDSDSAGEGNSIDYDCVTPSNISEDEVSQLDHLFTDKSESVTLRTQDLNKQERTQVHVWVRQRYAGKLQSRTENNAILVSFSKDNRKRRQWPSDRPDYLHFTLSKENKDTQYALSIVAKFLGTKVANLGIRGTKDRRAVTAQRVSLQRYEADRVKQLNPRLRGIRLSDFNYGREPCSLGEIWGNRFYVVLRNLGPFSDEEAKNRLKELETKGFINYFGTQRFGSCSSNTASVGLAIVKREWKEAVQMILSPRDVNGSLGDALRTWKETEDAALAFKKLSGGQAFASIESRLLAALSEGDHHSALMSLSRNTRSLYVHAYQSLLWNKVASKRIKGFGLVTLKGDIDVEGNEVAENEDLSKVALPLPSSEMKLPNNIIAEWYKELLEEDGVQLEMFSALARDYVIAGVLRPLVVKPKDVEFEMTRYSEPNARLQPDLDGQVDADSCGLGDRKALIVRFSVPSGSYATVALREITRCDMGKLSQSSSAKEASE